MSLGRSGGRDPLHYRERRIIEMRDEKMPPEAIAANLGISVGRVKQIERQARMKLAATDRPEGMWVVMTTAPHPDGEFIELEDERGRGIGPDSGIGWRQEGDRWLLGPFPLHQAEVVAAARWWADKPTDDERQRELFEAVRATEGRSQ